MDNLSEFSRHFTKIISHAVSKKMYGSIEIYFEAGRITQVTQRIINKIHKKDQNKKENITVERKDISGNRVEDAGKPNTLLTN